MDIKNLTPGGFASNYFLVTEGKDAVLVDCSAPAADVLTALRETGAVLHAILLTHGHFDHLLTLADVKAKTGARIYLSREDRDLPSDGEKNAYAVIFGADKTYPEADVLFDDGDTLTFGALSLRVMHTPGHTRGSSLFLCGDIAFTGDTIFAAGYGRYDLYGGDPQMLAASLKKIAALNDSTVLYHGHGENDTLAEALSRLY